MSKELDAFFECLDQACECLGKPLRSESAKEMYLAVLSNYTFNNLKGALMAHMRDPERGRFVPTPADLVFQINQALAKDGRPDADEAWAIAARAMDEAQTVVTNDEIAQAASIAAELWPDKTASRMAFRTAYERIVAAARTTRAPVRWFASIGQDPMQREAPLLQAVQLGRIPAAMASAFITFERKNQVALTHESSEPNFQLAQTSINKLRQRLNPPKQIKHEQGV